MRDNTARLAQRLQQFNEEAIQTPIFLQRLAASWSQPSIQLGEPLGKHARCKSSCWAQRVYGLAISASLSERSLKMPLNAGYKVSSPLYTRQRGALQGQLCEGRSMAKRLKNRVHEACIP